jgi:hypothetical protein
MKSFGMQLTQHVGRDFGRNEGLREVKGLVQVGAAATAGASQVIEEMVKEIKARTGWDDATVRAMIAHSYTPAEGQQLTQRHAAVSQRAAVRGLVSMEGLVSVGRKKGPFDFLSQFDPTWPKAKFGSVVRAAIVDVAATVGIPAGPIIDSFAGMAQTLQGHPASAPGPLPPMHPPMGGPLGPHRPRKGKKWSTGKKLAVAGAVGVGAYVVYRMVKGRTPNPKRRRRNPKSKRGKRR